MVAYGCKYTYYIKIRILFLGDFYMFFILTVRDGGGGGDDDDDDDCRHSGTGHERRKRLGSRIWQT